MSFSLPAALRRLKPQYALADITRRSDRDLSFATASASAGPELVLDTCVYVDVLQGRPYAALLMSERDTVRH